MIFSISLESDNIFCDEEWSFSLPAGPGSLETRFSSTIYYFHSHEMSTLAF